jgi:threonine dehydrogenase-like Zn-dependent dehydrogenase
MSMKALVKYSPELNDVRIIRMPVPKIGPKQVLIRSPGCGVCIGDQAIWRVGPDSSFVKRNVFPLILGNENYGVIEEVGRNIERWKVGDRVVSEHRHGCGECLWCRTGLVNLCPRGTAFGRRGANGTMCEFFATPSKYVHRIPDNVSGLEASLSEKLATVSEGVIVQGGGINPGETVVVIGPGPIGQLAAQVARLSGALNVVVTGLARDTFRLGVAEELGATRTVNIEEEDPVEVVKDLTDDIMADVVIQAAVVNPAALTQAVNLVRRNGRLMNIGLGGSATVNVPWTTMSNNEVRVTGTSAHAWWSWEYSLRMMATKRAKFEQVITVKLPYEEWKKAFMMQETREPPYIQGFLYWKEMDWEMTPPEQ